MRKALIGRYIGEDKMYIFLTSIIDTVDNTYNSDYANKLNYTSLNNIQFLVVTADIQDNLIYISDLPVDLLKWRTPDNKLVSFKHTFPIGYSH